MKRIACKSLMLCLATMLAAGCSHDVKPIYDSSTAIARVAVDTGRLEAAEAALATKGFRPYPSKKQAGDLDLWYYRALGQDWHAEQHIQVRGLQGSPTHDVLIQAICRFSRATLPTKHPKHPEAALIGETENARRSVVEALTKLSVP